MVLALFSRRGDVRDLADEVARSYTARELAELAHPSLRPPVAERAAAATSVSRLLWLLETAPSAN
jgi:hypothetical protein